MKRRDSVHKFNSGTLIKFNTDDIINEFDEFRSRNNDNDIYTNSIEYQTVHDLPEQVDKPHNLKT